MTDNPQLPAPRATSSLIGDLAGLGQLATCIVQSLGAGAGVLYGARKIRKEGEATAKALRETGIAQADVVAYAIRERAKAHVDALSLVAAADLTAVESAGRRLRFTMTTEEMNLDSIGDKACGKADAIEANRIPPEGGELPLINPDWIKGFVTYAKDVSHEYVQEIWALILARQAQGGDCRISLMTLDRLRLMEYRHAVAFKLFCCCYVTFGAFSYFSKDKLVSNTEFEWLEELGFIRQLEVDINDLSYSECFRISADGSDDVVNSLRFFDLSFRVRELATIVLPEMWAYIEEQKISSQEHRYDFLSKELQAHILATWAERYANVGVTLQASIRKASTDAFRLSHRWNNEKKGWERQQGLLDRDIPPELILSEIGRREI